MNTMPLPQDLRSTIQVLEPGDIGRGWPCIVVGVPAEGIADQGVKELDAACASAMARALEAGDFKGEVGEALLLRPHRGAERIVLAGLGPAERINDELIRRAFAAALKRLVNTGAEEAAILVPSFTAPAVGVGRAAELLAETVGLTFWRLVEYLGEERRGQPGPLKDLRYLVNDSESTFIAEALRRGVLAAAAAADARLWSSLPPNVLTPAAFADIAVSRAAEWGMAVDVFDEDELAAGGFGAILAVGQGSVHPPRLVIIDSDPDAKEQPFLLVGKGITFDSGGISIKPAADMHQMKGDMTGAAAVLAALTAYKRGDGQRRIAAALPLAENMPGAQAQRPGDIVRAWNGTTIEVLNTDAEGRLVLADALAYAIDRFQPVGVIDVATLTGAVSIALGAHAIGMLGTGDDLCAALEKAGNATWERVWRLPLFDEYFEQIKSPVADIQNTGGRPAGTITAAFFLKQFVGETPWVHLDIAGVDWREKEGPYLGVGPTGAGARLLLEFVRGL